MNENRGMKFTNPNLNISSQMDGEETGIHAIDAADKIFDLIYKDSLTDCFNQNYLNKVLKPKLELNKNSIQTALIFIDFNGLKEKNDTEGHAAGNNLIINTAKSLKDLFEKEEGVVVRIGGDEFLIVCQNRKNDPNFEKNLYLKLDQKRTTESSAKFAQGIAFFDKNIDLDKDGNPSLIATLKRADELMYKNKKDTKLNKEN